MERKPVFFISPPKTASKSYAYAVRELGWRPVHNWRMNSQAVESGEWEWFEEGTFSAFFDGLADSYREVFFRFPNSWFLLSVRNPFEIAISKFRHSRAFLLAGHPHLNRDWLDVEKMEAAARIHYRNVLEFFTRRNALDRLVIVRPEEGWRPLCEGLGVPEPSIPFPWRNPTDKILDQIREDKGGISGPQFDTGEG